VRRVICIKRDGTMEFVYDDQLKGLMSHGRATVERASHVEPGKPEKGQDPNLWYVDLSPLKGPVMGGFKLRNIALRKELEWINENLNRQ